jgi:Mg-chelatase subunit ChlD
MSNLFSAVNSSGNTRTWNGMRTNATSLSPALDLYYKIGAARGKFETIAGDIAAALGSDKDVAVRIILWSRDVRNGAGERQTFRDAIDFMAENQLIDVDEARRIMRKIPELGRWDDLKAFIGTGLESEALELWAAAIPNDGLAAKWAPRKGEVAAKLRRTMGLTPKAYRKTVVGNTAVVETAMCAKDWDNINFSHVPSLAASRYQKAFGRNATAAYEAYKAELVKPEAERDPKVKINAKAVYPYDIVKAVRQGDATVASEQWKALPDYMEGSEYAGIMPMVDVSGSMECGVGGAGYDYTGKTLSCLDVAVSLGLYLSERNRGIFKDEFLTFSGHPELVKTTGDLKNRIRQMSHAKWGMNTNIVAAFDLMVDSAVRANLSPEDMPRTLLILSDMQFDHCARFDNSALESVRQKFVRAGYEPPNVVFWNINSSGNGVPATNKDTGVALVSGFSPSIMASILNAKDFTPEAIMMKTIMNERYNW